MPSHAATWLTPIQAAPRVPIGAQKTGFPALASALLGSDGYRVVLALGEVDPSLHPGAALIADAMTGNPLDAHSDPLKLVATEDKRPARSVPNLTNIERKLFV